MTGVVMGQLPRLCDGENECHRVGCIAAVARGPDRLRFTSVRKRVAGVLLGLVLAACGSGPSAISAQTTTTAVAAGALCPEGVQASGWNAELGEDAPGGPATPEDALATYLQAAYPNLAVSQFTKGRNGEAVTFIYREPELGTMTGQAQYYGDSWEVTSGSSCESLDRKYRKHG